MTDHEHREPAPIEINRIVHHLNATAIADEAVHVEMSLFAAHLLVGPRDGFPTSHRAATRTAILKRLGDAIEGAWRKAGYLGLSALILAATATPAHAYTDCATWHVTAYTAADAGISATTADGTSIYSGEPIAAAPTWVPFDAEATVAGLGTYRIADRIGRPLGHYHLDVFTDANPYAITGQYEVCIRW